LPVNWAYTSQLFDYLQPVSRDIENPEICGIKRPGIYKLQAYFEHAFYGSAKMGAELVESSDLFVGH